MFEAVTLLLVILVGSIFYLFPAMVAHYKRHRQQTAILILNLLLGWTFLGWVLALVWAFWTPYHPPADWRQ